MVDDKLNYKPNYKDDDWDASIIYFREAEKISKKRTGKKSISKKKKSVPAIESYKMIFKERYEENLKILTKKSPKKKSKINEKSYQVQVKRKENVNIF